MTAPNGLEDDTPVDFCDHYPPCPAARISLDPENEEPNPASSAKETSMGIDGTIKLPTKVLALVADLQSLDLETKWFVVDSDCTYETLADIPQYRVLLLAENTRSRPDWPPEGLHFVCPV